MTSLFGRAARSAALFLPLICLGDPSKIASDLAKADPHSVVNVIVQFKTPPSSQDIQAVNQLGGNARKADLGFIKGAAFSVPATALNGLSDNPNVLYISPDR